MQATSIHDSRLTTCGIQRERGFSLIEMVIVIAITGIIGAMVAVFMRRPVESYVDSARRAELTDIADTALRRITRDLRRALPNSVRVDGTKKYLEYLQTSGGGRYRSDFASDGTGEPLTFDGPDTHFDVLGPMPTSIAIGDMVVIYNLGPGSGTTDAYNGGNSSAVTGFGASDITFASKTFPFPSPGKRFQTISGPVTYVCDSVAGTLRRISGYAVTDPQPTNAAAAPLSTAPVNALLATSVTACSFDYAAVTQRVGTLAISLQIAQSGESVQLFQQANINNVP